MTRLFLKKMTVRANYFARVNNYLGCENVHELFKLFTNFILEKLARIAAYTWHPSFNSPSCQDFKGSRIFFRLNGALRQ